MALLYSAGEEGNRTYIRPLPIEADGRNFTDRGTEDHGVPWGPDSQPKDSPELCYDRTGDAGYESSIPETDPTDHVDPVPVRIVNDDPVEFKSVTTLQFPIGTDPVRVLGKDLKRTRVLLLAVTTDIYIKSSQDVDVSFDYPISGTCKSPVELFTHDELWAISASSGTLYLAVERSTNHNPDHG